MKNGYGEITQQICRVGLWFLGSALPLIGIYIYTKYDLNANSSFKLLAGQGTGRTDRAATICSTLCIKIKKHCGDINMYMYDGINMIFFGILKLNFYFTL